MLAAFRDGKVLAEKLGELLRGHPKEQEILMPLRRLLQNESTRAQRRYSTVKRAAAVKAISEVRRRVLAAQASTLDRPDLIANLKLAYKKVLTSRQVAESDRTDESLHEWRKQTEHLWYQLDALKTLRIDEPSKIAGLRKAAHSLSDFLGDDHDLALLSERLPEEKEVAAFAVRIDRERKKLQRKAREFGRRLCREKPRRVAKRLERYLARNQILPAGHLPILNSL
jgi:hypothetical protein